VTTWWCLSIAAAAAALEGRMGREWVPLCGRAQSQLRTVLRALVFGGSAGYDMPVRGIGGAWWWWGSWGKERLCARAIGGVGAMIPHASPTCYSFAPLVSYKHQRATAL